MSAPHKTVAPRTVRRTSAVASESVYQRICSRIERNTEAINRRATGTEEMTDALATLDLGKLEGEVSETEGFIDYSESQWAEIDASVQYAHSIQAVAKARLLKNDREFYRRVARDYLSAPSQAARTALQSDWQKVAALSKKLHQKVLNCIEQTVPYNGDGDDNQLRELRIAVARSSLFHIGLLEKIAKIMTRDSNGNGNPRLIYQSKILEGWVVRLGGNLGISRHSRTQKVQGPLWRYFFAVAHPVMGASTPSPESLPDIVARQKLVMGEPRSRKAAAILKRLHDKAGRRFDSLYAAVFGNWEPPGSHGEPPSSQSGPRPH